MKISGYCDYFPCPIAIQRNKKRQGSHWHIENPTIFYLQYLLFHVCVLSCYVGHRYEVMYVLFCCKVGSSTLQLSCSLSFSIQE